jgi:hypothetical protein
VLGSAPVATMARSRLKCGHCAGSREKCAPPGAALRVLTRYAVIDGRDMTAEASGVEPAITGRPSYHPSILSKLYI